MKNRQYLHEMYNATITDDGKGNLETYENWLERQLLARIDKLEQLNLYVASKSFCSCVEPKYNYPEMIWCDNCTKEIKD